MMRKCYCDTCGKEIELRNNYRPAGLYKRKLRWYITACGGEFCEACIYRAVIAGSKRRKGGRKP